MEIKKVPVENYKIVLELTPLEAEYIRKLIGSMSENGIARNIKTIYDDCNGE